jgi:PAS domain S-box-containing protein
MPIDFGSLILNETPDAVIVTTLEGEVVCWTNGAQAVFGYTREEALGRRLTELIVPPSCARARPWLRRHSAVAGQLRIDAPLQGWHAGVHR